MQSESERAPCFLTPSHACSYLPDQEARTLFLDPREAVSAERYALLTQNGFRRSGAHLYRPECETCSACIATRIPSTLFSPSRNQKRTRRKNQNLVFSARPATYSDEAYDLYDRYISERHRDGDMYPASREQFKSFLLSSWSETLFIEARTSDQRLIAVAVTDRLPTGLSAIYTFFEPELAANSLGRLMVLKQIEVCAWLGLPYLYLGYWIEQSDKMRYKTEFRPVELFVNGQWVRLPRP